jgi:hypothetical protein
MQWEFATRFWGFAEQRVKNPWKAGHMADEHDLPRLPRQSNADPVGRIVWLQSPDRGELRHGIARAEKRFSRLTRAELAAVPDCARLHPSRGKIGGEPVGMCPAGARERALWIEVRPDGVGVVNEDDHGSPQ